MMKRSAIIALSVTGLTTGLMYLGGCDAMSGVGGGSGAGSGTLRVLVTDKPFPFEFIDEALVSVVRVEVRRADPESSATTDVEDPPANESATGEPVETEPESGDSWVVIFDGEKELNLLDLRNGRTDLLADATVEAGTYTEMRVVVVSGQVTLNDGRVFTLNVPSGAQTGIKLKLTFEVDAQEETVLLLDVDLSRAFSAIPSGKIDDPSTIREFRFTPTVAMRLINQLAAGSIGGTVTDANTQMPIENASVTAFKDGEEVTSTATEPDGKYRLLGLPTGTYRVEFSAGGFVDLTTDDVAVQAGEESTLDAELTPVVAP